MEILVELLIELFGELFLNIIFSILAKLFSTLFNIYKTNSKTKRIIKYILLYTFFGLVILLLTYSIVTNKNLLSKLILGYLIVILLINYIEFTSRNLLDHKYKRTLYFTKKALHYAFSITVLFVSIFTPFGKYKALIITLSILSIICFLILDIFRLRKIKLDKNKAKELDKNHYK